MKPVNLFALVAFLSLYSTSPAYSADRATDDLATLGANRGVLAVVGHRSDDDAYVTNLAKQSEWVVYYQSNDSEHVSKVRQSAENAGLLGERIFVNEASPGTIHLASNTADAILLGDGVEDEISKQELIRVLRPEGSVYLSSETLTKAIPSGFDDWTHPYHGPDNNPQSQDEYVKGNFRTQFLADPKFSPMPAQSVVGGGRVYKAMGHIAHKANQNEMLNTLLCINAYNGTILWKRPLSKGFMIHRNTMLATDDALYMGDHESCKIIDKITGQVRDEIRIPEGLADGPVWKWMGEKDGTLYALVGNPEIEIETVRSDRPGLGHWPWGMWEGHDYDDPRTSFGFGRTIVAIDLETQKVKWDYRDEAFLDARAIVMNGKHLYCYCPDGFLACIDSSTGKLLWKNTDMELLAAIGNNERAQHYITGYATTCYMKCNDDYLFFSGPQRKETVVASAKDGTLLWTYPVGNLQLVLREDGIYAAGPQNTSGVQLDYETGETLKTFPARRACTRATGCVDSIFFRATGGTVRVVTETNNAQHIAPMRPPCQDGVIVSNGHLYWGPWMCGCQLSLYGNICLAPEGLAIGDSEPEIVDRLRMADGIAELEPLPVVEHAWPTYRGSNARSDRTDVTIPAGVERQWNAKITNGTMPTGPVTAGDLVFVADRAGTVQAFDPSGQLAWKSYTGGPIYYPPTVAENRVFVGSADGRVYAFEAKTGRFLWSYHVAPSPRWIPIYGRLISTWPVAGGVVVQDGTVYAAAGIAHYDGTYVVALDAVTGTPTAQNDTSGRLSSEVNSGISMQGNLWIENGELRFLAGGVYETARFRLDDLACLNTPSNQVTSQFRTAFYPYYPSYGKFVSLDHTCDDGSILCHDASYEGSLFTNLALQPPLPEGVNREQKEAARWAMRRRGQDVPENKWQDRTNRRFTSFIVSDQHLLATGHTQQKPDQPFIVMIDIEDGNDVWLEPLPADVVKGGTAIDGRGRIFVTLENGEMIAFSPRQTE